MQQTTTICPYCAEPRDNLDGFHTCPEAQAAKASIEKSIEGMTRIANGERPKGTYMSPAFKERQARLRRDR